MGEPRLGPGVLGEVDAILAEADARLARDYPGDAAGRQPVHTLYLPADRASPSLVRELGDAALEALDAHAPDPETLAAATGLRPREVADAWPLVVAKLRAEPVEDLRLDLEDGYGARPDAEEDSDAVAAGTALRELRTRPEAPPYAGVRFKSLEAPTRRRGLRTLDLFLDALLDGASELPGGLALTLPKVTSVEQVTAMVRVCERLEDAHGLAAGSLRFEVQVETPQAVLGPDGTATVARLVHAADRRCSGLHYGTYDYSAALGIAAAYQSMEHPAADHAKAVLQLAAAGTGVRVSDGSTNVLPVGTREQVHAGWALHARLVRRSLERGFYQGWDLHPAQLVTRYLATYVFYRSGLPAAAARLRAYAERVEGGVLDEPATAQALAAFLRRGLDCGAVEEDEVVALVGLRRTAVDRLARRLPPEA